MCGSGDGGGGDGASNHSSTAPVHHRRVPLRQYEVVVKSLLEGGVEPKYHRLPPLPVPPPDGVLSPKARELWQLFFGRPKEGSAADATDSASKSAPQFSSPARVWGDLPGQLSDLAKARRKEDQVRSLLRCAAHCLQASSSASSSPLVVDFGGGSGHLAIPLSILFPFCQVLVVDLSDRSLQLLHGKARACVDGAEQGSRPNEEAPRRLRMRYPSIRATALPNLFTFCGPVQALSKLPPADDGVPFGFHLGLALHLCGEATDVALRLCARAHASLIAAPCCVGKLSAARNDPNVLKATGSVSATVTYPQSTIYRNLFVAPFDGKGRPDAPFDRWNVLAKAADYSQVLEYRSRRNAARRTAKTLLEWDRCLFLREQAIEVGAAESQGEVKADPAPPRYSRVFLTRLEPWEASPKNDVIVAVASRIPGARPPENLLEHLECAKDLRWTREHLRLAVVDAPPPAPGADARVGVPAEPENDDPRVDWTRSDELEIEGLLRHRFGAADPGPVVDGRPDAVPCGSFHAMDSCDSVYRFPPNLGRRRRKLVHSVADRLGLEHWSDGRHQGGRTVAVALPGTRRRLTATLGNGARDTEGTPASDRHVTSSKTQPKLA